MATAAVNVAFGAGTGMAWFCTFWALNGVLQGFGGPCCARILTSWFATKERGTYWGMWNIAHNLGGFGKSFFIIRVERRRRRAEESERGRERKTTYFLSLSRNENK